MKKNILHYSLLASTSVLAVVAILLGFSQYNNAISTNSVATNADWNTDLNVAAVAQTGAPTTHPIPIALPAVEKQVRQIKDSIILPLGYTQPVMTAALSQQYQQNIKNNVGDLYPTSFCANPISISHAQSLVNLLATQGINASAIISVSRQYVDWYTATSFVRGGGISMVSSSVRINTLMDAIENRLGYMSDA